MVLGSGFEQPIGAAADVKELEYVAALHKTGEESKDELNKPSIRAEDVQAFLISRYGIHVEKEEVLSLIFGGLAGGDSQDDCIDIMEIVAILIIPYLAKLVSDKDHRAHFAASDMTKKIHGNDEALDLLSVDGSTMTTDVLNIILADVVGSIKPQRLTKEFLREVFATYGEEDLINDDELLDDMILAATGGDPDCVLDGEAFTRALTSDLDLYDVKTEVSLSTNYEDVFGPKGSNGEVRLQTDMTDEERMVVHTDRKVRTVFSFTPLDFLAGTFRVKAHYIVVWVALFVSFVTYRDEDEKTLTVSVCTPTDHFGCTIANTILGWLLTLSTFVLFGVPFTIILSLGNQVGQASIYEILGGLAGIAILIFLPASTYFEWTIAGETIIRRKKEAGLEYVGTALLIIIGITLTVFQVWNIIRWYTEGKMLKKLPMPGGAVTDETRLKQSSRLKVFQMIRNAYNLHKDSKGSSSNQSSLLKFNKISSGEITKYVGGYKWAWKQFLTGKLLSEEGIWIPSKIIVGCLAMFLVNIFYFIIVTIINSFLVKSIYGSSVSVEGSQNNSTECFPVFDPYACSYPVDYNSTSYGVAVCNIDLPSCVESKVDVLSSSVPLALFCALLTDAYAQNPELLQVSFEDYFDDPLFGDLAGDTLSDIATDFVEEFSPCPSANSNGTLDMAPTFLIPKSNETIYAIADESTKEAFCASPITACATFTNPSNFAESTVCIMGIFGGNVLNNVMKPKFEGDLCGNYTFIDEINKQYMSSEIDVDVTVSKEVLEAALYIGVIVAFITGMLTTLGFIPSVIIMVLKFRSGVIPLLRDKKLVLYRILLQHTTRLLGAMFWGAVYSFGAINALVNFLVFIILWKPTQPIVLQIIAVVIAITVTILLRMLVVKGFGSLFSGFYRRRSPAIGNVFNLALESWDFGITAGYMVIRFVKILAVTFSYIGRFDTPLLSEDANDAKLIYVDTFPLMLRSCILSMEAHRHPYLERLGLMYMMKLKYGDKFAKRSGSMWRLLFVFALMPWLRKYRVSNEEDVDEAIVQDIYGGTAKKLADLQSEIKRLKSSRFLVVENDDMQTSDKDTTLHDSSDEDEPLLGRDSVTSMGGRVTSEMGEEEKDDDLADNASFEADLDGSVTKSPQNKL